LPWEGNPADVCTTVDTEWRGCAKVQTFDFMLAVTKAAFIKRYDIKLQIILAFNGQYRIGGKHEQYDDSTSKQRP
jgi:hypothetical protein